MGQPTTPSELNNHDTLIYWLPGGRHTWKFQRGDQIDEMEMKPRHLTNNGIVLRDLALRGEGIALLDDHTVAADIETKALVRLLPEYRITYTSFDEGIFATILDTPVIPAKVRCFLDFVADHISEDACGFPV